MPASAPEIQFLRDVLPATGRYVLFQNKGHTFYESIESIADAIDKRRDTLGLYFGTAGYGLEDRRTQANVTALRAWRIDVDAGVAKLAKHGADSVYAGQRESLAAIAHAITGGLPIPTYIVSSGEGIHIYWSARSDVRPELWKTNALGLNKVCTALGLKVDLACTADEARVLRPPGTLHNNGKRVTMLRATGKFYEPEDFQKRIAALLPPEDVMLGTAPKRVARNINEEVLQSIEVKSPPSSLIKIADHCSAVALMRDKLGCVPEPHWRAVIGVGKYCVDGEEVIHQWSEGYNGYDHKETQRKLERWETPPTTCKYFESSVGHSGCFTCPHKGKITTPKQLGYVSEEPPAAVSSDTVSLAALLEADETPASTDIPVPDRPDLFDEKAPFFFKRRGEYWSLYHTFRKPVKDEATGKDVWVNETLPVAHRLFWVMSMSLPGSGSGGSTIYDVGRILQPKIDRVDTFQVSAELSQNTQKMMECLAAQGVNVASPGENKNARAHAMEFIAHEIRRKQHEMRFVIRNHFGYNFHEGKMLGSLGPLTVHDDGKITRTMVHPEIEGGMSDALGCVCLPESTAGEWPNGIWPLLAPKANEYVDFLRKHYSDTGFELPRLTIALALASPFLAFCAESKPTERAPVPATGFVVSMYSSSSGVGKTALMKAVSAAYGSTSQARKGNQAAMTYNAMNNLAVWTSVFPYMLDEVTQNESGQAAAIVDMLANGQGKKRGTATNGVAGARGQFALVSLLATNKPQRELLSDAQSASSALQMRMLELNFDGVSRGGDREAFREDMQRIESIGGVYGLMQMLQVTRLGADRMAELGREAYARARAQLHMPQDYRFFEQGLAALMLSVEIMGPLAPFSNMDELVHTFKSGLEDLKLHNAQNKFSTESELAMLINSISGSIAVTKTWTEEPGGNDLLINTPKMPLYGREVQSERVLYIDVNQVRLWCLERQISMTSMMRDLVIMHALVLDDAGGAVYKRQITQNLLGQPTVNGQYFKIRTGAAFTAMAADNVVKMHRKIIGQPEPTDKSKRQS